MTGINFAELVKQYGGSEPIPDGEYDIEITQGAVKSSRTNPPKWMVEARYRILSGPYANRAGVHNFVLTPDNDGAMYHWFRNFAVLGLTDQFWGQLNVPIDQALPMVAQSLAGRQAHVSLKTSGSRQNVDSWSLIGQGAPSVPMPQAPQPGYGMQPQMATPPLQPPGQPVMQGQSPFPQQPQPTVGPPPMQPQMPTPPAPQPQAPPGMPGQPQMPPQPAPQPAPVPPGGVAPPVQPQMPTPPGFPQQQAAPDPNQPGAGGQPQMPAPPGFPQQPQAEQPQLPGQPLNLPQQPPQQPQQYQQPLPVPGNPPPVVPT